MAEEKKKGGRPKGSKNKTESTKKTAGRKKLSLPEKKQKFFNSYGRDKEFMDWVYGKNEKTYPGFKYLKEKWPEEFDKDYRYYLQSEINKAVDEALDEAKDDYVETGKYRTHSDIEDKIIAILKSAGPLNVSERMDAHTFTYDQLAEDQNFVEGISMVAFMYDVMEVENPNQYHPVYLMHMITSILNIVKK